LIYLDTSAFLKTVIAEPESGALGRYLSTFGSPRFVSSALLAVEARRSILRTVPAELPRVDLELLDVIHVATALLIRDDLDVLVTYDQRMLAAAAAHGLPAAAPT
jgi:predicted nucleic acid-binding protein